MNVAYPTDPGTRAENDSERPDQPSPDWRPQWTVDVGDGCQVGLAIDDGCFVVLYRNRHGWRPGKHVPKQAAEKMAQLLSNGVLS